MKSFITTVLLSCFVSLLVFGDSAMGEPSDPVGRFDRIPRPAYQTPVQSPTPPQRQPQTQSQVPPQRQPQPSNNFGNTRGTSGNGQRVFQLQLGDVILEINGETIYRQEDVTSAIARSAQTMYLTIRDGRTGTVARFVTTLNSSRPRFGVSHQTNPGGGSKVTGVNSNSPATRLIPTDSEPSRSPVNQSAVSGGTEWQPVPANKLDSRTHTTIRNTISGQIDGHVNRQATVAINRGIDQEIRSGKVKVHINNSGVYRVTSEYGDFLLNPNGQVDWSF